MAKNKAQTALRYILPMLMELLTDMAAHGALPCLIVFADGKGKATFVRGENGSLVEWEPAVGLVGMEGAALAFGGWRDEDNTKGGTVNGGTAPVENG